MNGFFERLVNRSLEVKPPAVQPRLPSWYEPQPALGMPPIWAAPAESSGLDEAGLLERNEQVTAVHPPAVHIPGETGSLQSVAHPQPQAEGREIPGSVQDVPGPDQLQPRTAQERLVQSQQPPGTVSTHLPEPFEHSRAVVKQTERSLFSPRSLEDLNPQTHQDRPQPAVQNDEQAPGRLEGNGVAAVYAAHPSSFVPTAEGSPEGPPQRPSPSDSPLIGEEAQMARALARLVESERAAHARAHPAEEQLTRENLALAPRAAEINPPPLVRVQIGRVEIQVTRPGDTKDVRAAQQKKHAPRSPVLSLDAYLNERARTPSTGDKP